MEILRYKEFEGSAELDMARNVCRGKILHIDDVVTYESKSVGGLEKQFEDAVDDYIETCKQIGKSAQKPCRGQFNVRVGPELHREAVRRSVREKISLNEVVCRALSFYLVPVERGGVSSDVGESQAASIGRLPTFNLSLATPSGIYGSRGSSAVSFNEVQKLDDGDHQLTASYMGTVGAADDLTRVAMDHRYVN